jgi:hypothetical protein
MLKQAPRLIRLDEEIARCTRLSGTTVLRKPWLKRRTTCPRFVRARIYSSG